MVAKSLAVLTLESDFKAHGKKRCTPQYGHIRRIIAAATVSFDERKSFHQKTSFARNAYFARKASDDHRASFDREVDAGGTPPFIRLW